MILAFHNIGTYSKPLPAKNDLSLRKFRSLIVSFMKAGFTFVPLEEYLAGRKKDTVVLTFDDGYCDQYYAARQVLEPLNVKACFFITTSKINGLWDSVDGLKINSIKDHQIKYLYHAGNTVASHGHLHEVFEKHEELEKDLLRSFDILKSLTGEVPAYYSAPFGVINKGNRDALENLTSNYFSLGRTGQIAWGNRKGFFNRVPVNHKDSVLSLKIKSCLYLNS